MMIPVHGATAAYERRIREKIACLPPWYVEGARVSRITVDASDEVKQQIAMYRHGTRDILVSPLIGELLLRTLSHEMAHGFDDGKPEKSAHRFSRSAEWMDVWRNATSFEILKYRDDPKEYFADMASKVVILGPMKLQLSHPRETTYLTGTVIPTLIRESRR